MSNNFGENKYNSYACFGQTLTALAFLIGAELYIWFKINVFLIFRIYRPFVLVTFMFTDAHIGIFNSILLLILPYTIFFLLNAPGSWSLSSSHMFHRYCLDNAVWFLYLELSSRLLSLGIPGGCGGWIVLIVYVEFFASLLIFYLSCRLPVLW